MKSVVPYVMFADFVRLLERESAGAKLLGRGLAYDSTPLHCLLECPGRVNRQFTLVFRLLILVVRIISGACAYLSCVSAL